VDQSCHAILDKASTSPIYVQQRDRSAGAVVCSARCVVTCACAHALLGIYIAGPDDASPSVVCAAGTLAQPPGRPAPVAVRLEQTTRACEARRTALASCSAGGLDCIGEVDKRERTFWEEPKERKF